MLRRCVMGDGNAINHALFAEWTDLRGLMPIYGPIGSRLIVQIVDAAWTEAMMNEWN